MLSTKHSTQGPGVIGLPSGRIDQLDLTAYDSCVVGIPFDGGVPGVPGQRHGPEIARAYGPKYEWTVDGSGYVTGPLDPCTGRPVVDGIRVADLGDLGGMPLDPRIERRAYYAALSRLARRMLPAVGIYVGGDHSITAALIEGVVTAESDLSLVCFDAHCDYTGTIEPLHRVTHADFLGHTRSLDGIAGIAVLGCRVPLPQQAHPLPANLQVRPDLELPDALAGTRVWLSIDLDVLDPSQFPATGHPAPGGFTVRELVASVRTTIQRCNVLGIDITEAIHSPSHDQYTGSVIGTVILTCLSEIAKKEQGTGNVQ